MAQDYSQLKNLSQPQTEKEYWQDRYSILQAGPYSAQEFRNDYYTNWEKTGRGLKQLGLSVAHDFYLFGGASVHSSLANAPTAFDTPEITERRDKKLEQVENDLQTLYQIKNRNNSQFVNEFFGGQLAGEIVLGLTKTGVHSLTGGIPITSFASTYGEKYVEGINSGMSTNKAMYFALTSGSANALLEYAGAAFLPKGTSKIGKVLWTGAQESLEEVEQTGTQALIDAFFYDGKPPQAYTEDGQPQWDKYFRQLGKEALMSAIMGFVVGGAMGGFQKFSNTNKIQQQVQAANEIEAELNNFTKTQLSPEQQVLLSEAKRYKSAEEFVKAQGKTLYHGGTDIKKVENMQSKWGAFYMSENPTYAKSYGGDKSVLNEMVLLPEAKLADLRKPNDELINEIENIISPKKTGKTLRIQRPDGSFVEIPETKGGLSNPVHSSADIIKGIRDEKAYFAEMPEVKQALKQLGYDGMITQESKFGANYGVWNKNVIKTKSQLTDIWNKANTDQTSIPGVQRSQEQQSLHNEMLTQAFMAKAQSLDNPDLEPGQLLPNSMGQPTTTFNEQYVSELNRLYNQQTEKEMELQEQEASIEQDKQVIKEQEQLFTKETNKTKKQLEIIEKAKAKIEQAYQKSISKYKVANEKIIGNIKLLQEQTKGFINTIDDSTVRKELRKFDLTKRQQQISFLSKVKKTETKATINKAQSLINKYNKQRQQQIDNENLFQAETRRYNEDIRKIERKKKQEQKTYGETTTPLVDEINRRKDNILATTSQNKILDQEIRGLAKMIHKYDRLHQDRLAATKTNLSTELSNIKPTLTAKLKNKQVRAMLDYWNGLDTLETVFTKLKISPDSYLYKKFITNTRIRRNESIKLIENMQQPIKEARVRYEEKTGRKFVQDMVTDKEIQYEIDGKPQTLNMNINSMIDVYIKAQNEKGLYRLLNGNKLHANAIQAIIQNLTPEQIEIGNIYLESYNQFVTDLAQKYESMTGKRFKKELMYSTLYTDYDFLDKHNVIDDTPQELDLFQFMPEDGTLQTQTKSSIAKERQISSAPLELDALNNYTRYTKELANYLAFADHIAELNMILSQENSKLLTDIGGSGLVNTFSEYIRGVARDNPNYTKDPFWKVMKGLRVNATKFVLPFNLRTIAIQPISAFSVCDRVSYANFTKATVDTLKNFSSIRETMKRLDPKSYFSGYDLGVDELQLHKRSKNKLAQLSDTASQVGFLLLKQGDIAGKTVAWQAAFTQAQQDMPNGTEQDWATFASQAVSETQPTTYAEDLPKSYYQESFRSLFGAFSNQRIKYWNLLVRDLINGKVSYGTAIKKITKGVLIPQLLVTLIQNGFAVFWNEDDEDRYTKFATMYANNIIGLNPIINTIISLSSFGNQSTFALSGIQKGAMGTAQTISHIKKGDLQYQHVEDLVKGIFSVSGVPVNYLMDIVSGVNYNIANEETSMLNLLYSSYHRNKYFEQD